MAVASKSFAQPTCSVASIGGNCRISSDGIFLVYSFDQDWARGPVQLEIPLNIFKNFKKNGTRFPVSLADVFCVLCNKFFPDRMNFFTELMSRSIKHQTANYDLK